MPLRIPGTSNALSIPDRRVSSSPSPDLPVLLQQYQEQHEQSVSGMSKALRREDDTVESRDARRVGTPSRFPLSG